MHTVHTLLCVCVQVLLARSLTNIIYSIQNFHAIQFSKYFMYASKLNLWCLRLQVPYNFRYKHFCFTLRTRHALTLRSQNCYIFRALSFNILINDPEKYYTLQHYRHLLHRSYYAIRLFAHVQNLCTFCEILKISERGRNRKYVCILNVRCGRLMWRYC